MQVQPAYEVTGEVVDGAARFVGATDEVGSPVHGRPWATRFIARGQFPVPRAGPARVFPEEYAESLPASPATVQRIRSPRRPPSRAALARAAGSQHLLLQLGHQLAGL